ncbi:Reticuline oxidase-like protein [Acorus calamus]|uniref:Reticuline oxidase-like protein n=1 Tax=Acorus calamus TaxID=4465 RepID=A0AAV9E443_ACOCL|nr:Reticuline oxidase-like protein [Acorus calamus]
MALQSLVLVLLLLFPIFITLSIASQNTTNESFLHCLSHHPPPTYTPNTTSYNTLFHSTFHNLRFATSDPAAEPILIIAPANEAQAQASVACARAHQFNLRIRSGGHDYEGLSYRTLGDCPFVILDLSNLREIYVDVKNGFAWVQSGAIVGELYYKIAQASKTYVPVPPVVTVFTANRTLEQRATWLVHKWQTVAPHLDRRLFVRVLLSGSVASFSSMFLGAREELMRIMDRRFPELGLKAKDCVEMSWIEAAVYFAVNEIGRPAEVLLDRSGQFTYPFKGKSDFVREPIPEKAVEAIFGWLKEETLLMVMDPWGGRMDDVQESEIPFPHRAGNLYNILYVLMVGESGRKASKRHVEWLRRFYEYMGGYVSKGPRRAYLNYRDLDLGWNKEGNGTSFEEGEGVVDPGNFFRNEQSIPPLIVKVGAVGITKCIDAQAKTITTHMVKKSGLPLTLGDQ